MNRLCAAFGFGIALVVTGLIAPVSAQNTTANIKEATAQQTAKMPVSNVKAVDYPIPAAQGPSWVKHLGLTISRTQMGQVGGTNSAPDSSPAKPQPVTGVPAGNLKSVIQRFLATFRSDREQGSAILNQQFLVSGSDLYRWSCQGCHGPEGKGAPPEINSVVGPVQGTSPVLTRKRMEARGLEVDDDMVNQVSELAEGSLRDRLQHGGKSMPSFEYLRADEAEALFGYLEKLAEVPPTKRNGLLVPESAARVGEHIVRGTCHICHDATGPGGGHMAMQQGTIPSLASIPRELSLSSVVHQVHYGSCDMMRVTKGEVMPAYPYFTEDEIAAVYLLTYSAQQ